MCKNADFQGECGKFVPIHAGWRMYSYHEKAYAPQGVFMETNKMLGCSMKCSTFIDIVMI